MIRIRNISRDVDTVQVRRGGGPLPEQEHVRIYTGDVATSTMPVVMETVLGSCVAVCLYDPEVQAGGMNHFLLPGSTQDPGSTRFGVNAMELLINELMKRGGERRRFVAKAFGGANVMHGVTLANIGGDNAEFVRSFLATEKIPLLRHRLGGTQPVRVVFRTDSGRATVHTVDGSQLHKVVHAEEAYRRVHVTDRNYSGEITLF
jgi:chemotaxis protein CheD